MDLRRLSAGTEGGRVVSKRERVDEGFEAGVFERLCLGRIWLGDE
jgi:hypothetical protein